VPTVTLILAVVVGIVILSVLAPIYDLTNAVS
jgi:general secretion pathway protein F